MDEVDALGGSTATAIAGGSNHCCFSLLLGAVLVVTEGLDS